MKALLDWIDAVPPITMGQFVVIVVPFMVAQTVGLLLLFSSESFWRRLLPAKRSKGGPDG